MKTIELTDKQVELLKRCANENYSFPTAPEDERILLMDVINKARALCEELDAYNESGENLLKWFYDKYLEQNEG